MYGWEAIQEGEGLTLMAVGVLVVFSALIFLIAMMKSLKIYQDFLARKRLTKSALLSGREPGELEGDIPGVVVAAVALTLILEEEQIHDEESMVLTLRSLPKPYNNWILRDLSSESMFGTRQPQTKQIIRTIDPLKGTEI
jgi:Na+-transporting methylmalonyl-CoA/oxaloacetate decarboxylase gamma subunit